MPTETQSSHDEPQSSFDRASDRRLLTPRERRRRWILLAILLILLALLSYAAYYFIQNRKLPAIQVAAPEAILQPPQYLYSITGQGKAELDRPIGVGVGPDRRVYVVDFGNSRVSVFTNAGRYLFSFNKTASGTLRNPVHLVIKDNEVWVTDRRLRQVAVFDLGGKFLRFFTPKSEDLKWTPLALGFGQDGGLAITDVGITDRHRLHLFSAEGSRTATIGSTAQVKSPEEQPGSFLFPNGIAIAKDGRVFVSDGDNRRIQVFRKDGSFDYFVDTSGVPRGIAIDRQSRLFVVDAIAHTVDIYDLRGKRLTQFGGQGFGPGQFNYPNDVTVDARYRIYVTDRENNQVQVWGWPVAAPPTVTPPSTPWGWALCLAPLLLLFLPLFLRRTRIVVTPDFVESLALAGEIKAVSERKRIRLVAPEADSAHYIGKEVDGVALDVLVSLEPFSESDMRAIRDRLECTDYEAIVLAMASRAKALGSEDRELRRLAVLADVQSLSVTQFRERFLK